MAHLVVAVRVLHTACPMEEPAAHAAFVESAVGRACRGTLDLATLTLYRRHACLCMCTANSHSRIGFCSMNQTCAHPKTRVIWPV